MRDRSPLDELLSRHPCPTLGEIAFASNGERGKRWKSANWTRDEYLADMWRRYDAALANRADYRLWRVLFRPLYASENMNRWPKPEQLADNALGTPDPAVVWGTLSMLAGLLTRANAAAFGSDASVTIAHRVDEVLHNNLSPLSGAETECMLIKVLALDAVQKAQYRISAPDMASAESYVSRLERYLTQVDHSWVPGRALSMERIRRERRSGRVVVPFKMIDLTLRASYVMYRARSVVRAATGVKPGEQPRKLLERGLCFAYSAWRNTRSIRISIERQSLRNPAWKADYDEVRIWTEEMGALLGTVHAARDASQHLLAARQACLFLWVCPDYLVRSERFKDTGDQLGFAVRQVGLSVPKRFSRTEQCSAAAANKQPPSPDVCSDPSAPPPVDGTIRREDPFLVQLAVEQLNDPLWKIVCTLYPVAADTLRRVLHDNESGTLGDDTVRRAAFLLCIRYGQVHGAARLLERLAATKEDVLTFARALTDTLTALPFGVDVDRPRQWQRILRKQWALLSPTEFISFTPAELFEVHEALLGWGSRILQYADRKGAAMFARRFYGALTESEIGEYLDCSHSATAYGPRRITAADIEGFARRRSGADRDAPLCLSIVAVDENRLSVFGATAGYRWNGSIGSSPGGAKSGEGRSEGGWLPTLATESRRWTFAIGRFADGARGPVAMPASIAFLRREVLQLIQKHDAGSRWIIVAVDSNLASAPWQLILGFEGGQDTVVSVVPSLGWAARPKEKGDIEFGAVQLLSCADDLRDLAQQLRRDKPLLDRRLGAGTVVLGHGLRRDGAELTTIISRNGPVEFNDWVSLLARRITVLHSCHAGHVPPHLLGDCGGIPNLAMGLGARLICAPVCEVPVAAARVLHEEIVREAGGKTFGERYVAAVRRNRSVGLYNLYGFADEQLR